MASTTAVPGENGQLEIVCHRNGAAEPGASLTNIEGEISLLISDLEPNETVEIEIIESNGE
ncbi:hypothetical protein [Halococcus sediminicola]|uniref:hypothetical protein n=1 Tax=Halococcus sediminicola TaxID=1264579 RepID=UPI000679B17C|nr:hypothetical protein [Halococcus sediminicola]